MVYFRADANQKIGMGHIMRCLSTAAAAANNTEIGNDIAFILADDSVSKLIEARGYKSIILNSDYKNLEAEIDSWPQELPDILVVDSYYVTPQYLQILLDKMESVGGKLVYLDDILAFPYPVDALVNYNAFANQADYEKLYAGFDEPSIPSMVLGPKYAPLRSMFRDVPKKIQREKVENVLISTGGSDELHVALSLVYRLVGEKNRDNRKFHLLLGAMNTDRMEIKELIHSTDTNERIVIHENVSDMKNLIISMDIVVSAAGSTLYEICACGVPLVTYSFADNQLPGAESFERLGLAVNVGDIRDPKSIDHNLVVSGELDKKAVDRILKAVDKLSVDYYWRVEAGARMQKMIDGYGADRMVLEIMNK